MHDESKPATHESVPEMKVERKSKLTLHRQTLRALENESALEDVVGGVFMSRPSDCCSETQQFNC